jgi:hypothetical protein
MTLRLKTIVPTSTVLLLMAAAMSGPAVAQQPDPTATATAQIVKARDYTTEYVVIAKQAFAKNASDLQQARKLYASAYAGYGAWVAYVKTALQDGKIKRLGTDSEYQKTSVAATNAANTFTAFVDSKTPESKAVNAIFSSFGALGLQLWNGIKDQKQKERDAAATNFEQTVKWSAWEAITEDSLAKPKPSEPTKPSDGSKATKSTVTPNS